MSEVNGFIIFLFRLLKYRGKWNNIRVYFLNKFALIRNISYIDEKKNKNSLKKSRAIHFLSILLFKLLIQ